MLLRNLTKRNFSTTRGFIDIEKLRNKVLIIIKPQNLENQVENIYLGFPDMYGRLSTIKLNPDYFMKNIEAGFPIDSKSLNIDMVKYNQKKIKYF